MSDRMACGCITRDIPGGRDLPWAPGEAISYEVVEACRMHEDFARDAARTDATLRSALSWALGRINKYHLTAGELLDYEAAGRLIDP